MKKNAWRVAACALGLLGLGVLFLRVGTLSGADSDGRPNATPLRPAGDAALNPVHSATPAAPTNATTVAFSIERMRKTFAAQQKPREPERPGDLVLETGIVRPASTPSTASGAGHPDRFSPYLVQARERVTEDWKRTIEAAGGVVHGYVPNNACIVSMTEETRGRVTAMPDVQWIGAYRPEYKIEPFLQWLPAQAGVATDEPIPCSIQTFRPEDAGGVARAVELAGGHVDTFVSGKRNGLVRARIPLNRIVNLAERPDIQWIESYIAPRLINNFAVRGDHLNATNVWTVRGLTGSNQVIGHADSGLDIGTTNGIHPDFAGRIKAAHALGRTGDWSDGHGHGTHTAGSILGGGAASTGAFRGVAFEALLVHQSVMDDFGGLGGLPADLNELFLQTYTNDARIHSDSWGSSVYGAYTTDSRACDEFAWDHPDMLIVFSAGNDGADGNSDGVIDRDSIGAPATAKNILTVGAAENDRAPGAGGYTSGKYGSYWPSDYPAEPLKSDYISQSASLTNQGLAAFSSRGPTDDGRIKPDIVAPGTDIISCRSAKPGAGTGWGAHGNTRYCFNGGTSMACPLAAGAAALVRQFFTDVEGVQPSAALIKATLMNGARSLTPGQFGPGATQEIPDAPRPNNAEGWGQIDLEGTLFPDTPFARAGVDETHGLSVAQSNRYAFTVTDSNRLSLTLAYTDYPSTAGSGKKLVNDLDLMLIGPTGEVFYARSKAAPDRTNNVETLELATPAPGIYEAAVSGHNVPYGPQPYALAFQGSIGFAPTIRHTPLDNTVETNDPYTVEARIDSLTPLNTNALFVLWNTEGAGAPFSTSLLTRVSGDLFEATIPAQSNGITVAYYLSASSGESVALDPTNAPDTAHTFTITGPFELTVTGWPSNVGAPAPDYGVYAVASGALVEATAPSPTEAIGGTRYRGLGWLGQGATPASGDTQSVSFPLWTNSAIAWQWQAQHALTVTAAPPVFAVTQSWWDAEATAQTFLAESTVTHTGTTYRFAFWRLDGARMPDATNPTENPITAVMSAPRDAEALYVQADRDDDADGLPDWWELFYFGSTNADPGADGDLDGFNAAQEYGDRTDPRDALSAPQAPSVDVALVDDPIFRPAPWPVLATVTDNAEVAAVTLHWQRIGFDWQSVSMTHLGDGVYSNNITPGTCNDFTYYYVTAEDGIGLTTTSAVNNFNAGCPAIRIEPEGSTAFALKPGRATQTVVRLYNDGNMHLHWSVRADPAQWFDNVEDGTNGWTHSGPNEQWHISGYRAYSPTHAWYCGDDTTLLYNNSMDAYLDTPPVSLGASAWLTFRHYADLEYDSDQMDDHYWDGAVVELSTNGGASYLRISPTNGYPHRITDNPASPFPPDTPCYGATDGWAPATFDLSNFAGHEVRIRFRLGTDGYVVDEGWFIDDIRIVSEGLQTGWVNLAPTGELLRAGAMTNLTLSVSSSNLTAGSTQAMVYAFLSDDPIAPTSTLHVSLDVLLSPPIVAFTFFQQQGTNGEGWVYFSNTVYDEERDACDLEWTYSLNGASPWTSMWIQAAQAAAGGVVVTNTPGAQLWGIATGNPGEGLSNRVTTVWSVRDSPLTAYVHTNARARVRAWDGTAWSPAITSGPIFVDVAAPVESGAVAEFERSAYGPYVVDAPPIRVSWTNLVDPGIGIRTYYVALTNGGGARAGLRAETAEAELPYAQLDATNRVWIWAEDLFGNIGQALATDLLVLSPSGDWDGDGYNNAAEETLGSSAGEIGSNLNLEPEDTARPSIRWRPASNRQYTVEWSPLPRPEQPIAWIALTNPLWLWTNGWAVWTDTNAAAVTGRMYRLRVRQN